jgi:hypothetical protein
MALGRTMMALVVVGASGFAAINPGMVKAFYEDIYPSDPVMRQALDICFMEDHKFNRLDESARAACYRHTLSTLGGAAASAAGYQAGVNPVDLQRTVAEGSLPRNDARRLEQTQDVLHSAH